jgi:hypothetical protein
MRMRKTRIPKWWPLRGWRKEGEKTPKSWIWGGKEKTHLIILGTNLIKNAITISSRSLPLPLVPG